MQRSQFKTTGIRFIDIVGHRIGRESESPIPLDVHLSSTISCPGGTVFSMSIRFTDGYFRGRLEGDEDLTRRLALFPDDEDTITTKYNTVTETPDKSNETAI
jgi:hypothetical protein